MASPSNSSQNGGILGVSNKTSFGKNTVTKVTASTPSAVTTQPGTRFFNYVVAAGGGGGGSTSGGSAGGGGAGGLRHGSCISVCGNTALGAVVIGAGGAALSDGVNSSLVIGCTTFTSAGGGKGARSQASFANAGTGGSGGGGQGYTGPAPAGSKTGAAGNTPPVSPPQGNAGGDGVHSCSSANAQAAGGGGGAGAPGVDACQPSSTLSNGGAGGAGLDLSPLVGTTAGVCGVFSGGGGGGKRMAPGSKGAGGTGGGGAGGQGPSTQAVAGTVNTGGGGGGAGVEPSSGGAGGAGVVVIKELSKASGVWSMQSQFSAKSQGTWPKKLFNLTGAMMMVGGGGGTASAPSPGGGGAGGMIYMPSCVGATVMSGLESNTLDVTIGAGGGGQTGSPPDRGSQVQAGNNTILGSNLLIALGGGAGFTGGVTASIPGGSGGGGGGEAPSQTGGSTTQVPSMPSPLQPFGFGNAGGTGSACGGSPDRQGAGGGGAGAAGTPASSGSNGGSGKSVTPIFGSAPQPFYIANSSVAGVTVCGTFAGGGAGRQDPQRGGTGTYSGGSGGGGNAYSPTSSPSPTRGCGTANSGGGGGAGTCAHGPTGIVLTFGGQGGSGYVLIKTPAPALPAPGVFSISPGANAIVTQPCGAKIAKFAASGTLTFE